ncbi:type VII secretion protein EsaA [Niallia taxi]|uniref:type VII secretion protein EsaA n=1 Tax=Niallia taxi TaxID=2499688 RepID=UPI002934C389|nr:type VII secretion protein EsaA [Niallia taxi]WOD63358.1 type VII secretion protein EsaA [Niallia taxi]
MKGFPIWKIIIALVLIIGAPLLFFKAIGENPLKEKENATKSIAIVNEDVGLEGEEEEIHLGESAASILAKDSSYNWSVVGRSAGESGLRSNKYDAVIYIPSDFSKKVMDYESANPSKVTFDYKLQTQLNAVNTEKVKLEVEKATKRTNQRLSSLYWSYVATDMNSVKKEFDQILQKEVDFQGTMLAFYKPSSKDLADQIKEQQAMLENIKSSFGQVADQGTDQEASADSFSEDLTGFVENVQAYEQYQQEQQKLLASIQEDAVANISTATENQKSPYLQTQSLLNENEQTVLQQMTDLNSQLQTNESLLLQTKQERVDTAENQLLSYNQYQSNLLDYYQQLVDTKSLNSLQGNLIAAKQGLSEGDEVLLPEDPPENPEVPAEMSEEEGVDNPETGEEGSDSEKPVGGEGNEVIAAVSEQAGASESQQSGEGQEQQSGNSNAEANEHKELEGIQAALQDLEGKLTGMAGSTTSEEIAQAVEQLKAINERVFKVNESLKASGDNQQGYVKGLLAQIADLTSQLDNNTTSLSELETKNEDLNKQLDELTKQKERLIDYAEDLTEVNNELREQLSQYANNMTAILDVIEEKEQSIIASNALSADRKQELENWFDKDIATGKVVDLLYYYAYLNEYEGTLSSMLGQNSAKEEVMANDKFLQQIQAIFQVSDAENNYWNQIEEETPTMRDGLSALNDRFTVFMADYKKSVEDNQGKLLDSFTSMEADANQLLEQIQQPTQNEAGNLSAEASGTGVATSYKVIQEQMNSFHNGLQDASESQETIIEYTNGLHQEVSAVQTDADVLNNKWSTNVKSTELIRDDVFSVLGNAFVDDQSNGVVYDFLSSPLQLTAGTSEKVETNTVPPVVVLFIVLLSSLLIGYTTYYFSSLPYWVRTALFFIVNTLVGFIISLYGLKIYQLAEQATMEWTVFTILLLMVSSGLITAAFSLHRLVGLFVTAGVIALYVTPLLALSTPNFKFADPMSNVYISIQYSTESLFAPAAIILVFTLLLLVILQVLIERYKGSSSMEHEVGANETM